MQQILQSLKTGNTELADVPCPQVKSGQLLIRTSVSLVSAGTERMLVEFGKANLLDKARQQPDKVKMVLEKMRTDGILATLEAVENKLDQPLPLGYCNVGKVIAVGAKVAGFAVGDRVLSNGYHAEVVCVPQNLCARIPNGVDDDAAAFGVLGAIALQGIRLLQPTVGENFVVIGLGLIGLMAVQILKAQGCRVMGTDLNPHRLKLAQSCGAEIVDIGQGQDPMAIAANFSRGQGVDGVVITASTHSSEPVHQAATMCRKKGRIVLVGVTGLELARADFYKKELSFQVSCSYGPGRYDPLYEEGGHDYPLGFVRWTAGRNFAAVLDLLADQKIQVAPLVSHRFPLNQASQAYELIMSSEPSLGVLLQYPQEKATELVRQATVRLAEKTVAAHATTPVVGFIGAGSYAGKVLIPAFQKSGVCLKTIACSGGVSGFHAGRKFGFEAVTTDTESIFRDPAINCVVIATRHDTHASLVCKSLASGKHVFVEKPLALSYAELETIETAYQESREKGAPLLMVGFNRRFAPQVQKIKALLAAVPDSKSFIMTVNAGEIPADHWTQNPESGGGRILGEGCHFLDLLRFLSNSPIVSAQAVSLKPKNNMPPDTVTILLRFADGSLGTVHYLANGHKSFPKERLEIFCAGRILQLDNFRKLRGYGWPGFGTMNLWRQDKGNRACALAFTRAVQEGKASPIPWEELQEVALINLQVAEKK